MKKFILLLCAVCVIITLDAQPIRTTFGFSAQTYSPTKQIKPVRGPRGPQGIQGIQGVPGPAIECEPVMQLKTAVVVPKLDTTIVRNYYTSNITNPITEKTVVQTPVPNLYLRKGTGKIMAGAGLQVIAVGIIAYSKIPRYENVKVTTTHSAEYTYPTYTLIKNPPKPVEPCVINTSFTVTTTTVNSGSNKYHGHSHGHGHGHEKWSPSTVTTTTVVANTTHTCNLPEETGYTLETVYKAGTVSITDEDQVMQEKHINKNGYYIGAGILAAAGVALEISGIIDNHRANVYFTQNSVGVSFKF